MCREFDWNRVVLAQIDGVADQLGAGSQYRYFLVLGLLALIAPPALAQPALGQNGELVNGAIAGGGGDSSAVGWQLFASIGQPLAADSSIGDFDLYSGIHPPLPTPAGSEAIFADSFESDTSS